MRQGLRAALRTAVAGACALLLLLVMPGTQAHADPTVAQIEAQIKAIWDKAEPMVEEYNTVHDKYVKNKAKQADLQKRIRPLELQLTLGQLRVGAIAAEVYKGQGPDTFNALISAGSPSVLADQLVFLEQMAHEQQLQIAGVSAMKDRFDAQKDPIDQLVAQLAAQDADLAAKKTKIEAQIDQLQKLRLKAYGTTGGTGSFRPWPCPAEYAPTSGYKAAAYACKQAGDPYRWAAAGPNSFDCSGLTMASWQQVGVYLPHNAADQRRSMPYVSRSNLQVGDLVFYYSNLRHVAIYVGGGKVMHAPSPGDNVRMAVLEDVGPVHSYGRPK